LRAAFPDVPSVEEYLATITGKTGASVAYFAGIAAIAARRPEETIRRLMTYGESLGAYHQIMSDLADIRAPWGSGSDVRNRKLTLPILYGLSQDPSGRVRAWLEGNEPDLAVAEELERLGAPIYCRMKAQIFRRKALAQLDGLGLSSGVATDLRGYLSAQGPASMLEL